MEGTMKRLLIMLYVATITALPLTALTPFGNDDGEYSYSRQREAQSSYDASHARDDCERDNAQRDADYWRSRSEAIESQNRLNNQFEQRQQTDVYGNDNSNNW